MEPTIYKPGVYNTPGVYKGAGGIYKGRGVYNEGAVNRPGFFYEFNLSRFDLDTLKDGDVQWICTQPNLLSKESDCLAANANSSFKFYFRPDIDKTKKIISEFIISFPTSNFFYSGFGCFPEGGIDYNFSIYTIGSNTYFKNSGIASSIKNYNVYNGGYKSGQWTYNFRFAGFPYAQKQKIKIELIPGGHGKFYIDDVLSLEGDFNYDYEYFLNNFKFYINSQSNGVIKLFSLKIWQE